MAEKLIVVHVAYDSEAKVWYTESSDLFEVVPLVRTVFPLR